MRLRTASGDFLLAVEEQELAQAASRGNTPRSEWLLKSVLKRAKQVAEMQSSGLMAPEKCRTVDQICDTAHEEFARAYMVERMLLVESLKGVRDMPTPSFKEAVTSEFADYWNDAILTEIQNLESHDVWDFVYKKDLPPGTKLVDSKWAFRVKRNQAGEVDKMKAPEWLSEIISQVIRRYIQLSQCPEVDDKKPS